MIPAEGFGGAGFGGGLGGANPGSSTLPPPRVEIFNPHFEFHPLSPSFVPRAMKDYKRGA